MVAVERGGDVGRGDSGLMRTVIKELSVELGLGFVEGDGGEELRL
jgi:hypothetical protein